MKAKSEEKLANIGAGRNAMKLGATVTGGGVGMFNGVQDAFLGSGAGASTMQGIDALGTMGQSLVASGKKGLTPQALASSWLENPQLLGAAANIPGGVGQAAQQALRALQERGQDGLKARLFTLQAEPWLRKAISQDNSDEAKQSR